MKLGSKILIGFTIFLIVLSVSATFYKTVVLQDFEAYGAYIEFPTEDSSYIWFVYDNIEYEIELESSNYDDIILAVVDATSVAIPELDAVFLEYFKNAFEAAEIVEVKEDEAIETSTESEESNYSSLDTPADINEGLVDGI